VWRREEQAKICHVDLMRHVKKAKRKGLSVSFFLTVKQWRILGGETRIGQLSSAFLEMVYIAHSVEKS
jgi:hypothetical protein